MKTSKHLKLRPVLISNLRARKKGKMVNRYAYFYHFKLKGIQYRALFFENKLEIVERSDIKQN